MEKEFGTKFPKGVLSFYVKLYCKKKGQPNKKCTVDEAIKSWISLNKSEKELFEKKYKEYKDNYKKTIALHLKNAEPYLQRKLPTDNRNSVHSVDTSIEEVNQNELMSSTIVQVDDNVNQVSGIQNEQYNSPITNASLQDEVLITQEPIPPKVITSMDLFLKVNAKEDVTWKELTKREKILYQKAVKAIKANYLQQYKNYLEQLSPEDLLNYHKKIINHWYIN